MTADGRLAAAVLNQLNDKRLEALREAARSRNPYEYEKELYRCVRSALCLVKDVAGSRTGDSVILSCHYASVVMRKWFRIEHSREIWKQTDLSPLEQDQLRHVYAWDVREGHVLTDPSTRDSFDVLFGAIRKNRGQVLIRRATWRRFREVLRTDLCPLLIDRELDHVTNRKQLVPVLLDHKFDTGEVGRLERDLKEIRKLGTLVDHRLTATALRGRGEKVGRARSFLLSFFFSICCYKETAVQRVWIRSIRDPFSFRRREEQRDKIGSIALAATTPEDHSTPTAPIDPAELASLAEALLMRLRYFELHIASNHIHTSAAIPRDEDTVRRACDVDWEKGRGKDSEEVVSERLERLDLVHETIGKLYDERFPKRHPRLAQDRSFNKMASDWEPVGASTRYVEFLGRVLESVKAETREPRRQLQTVFLFSEPGCGKDNLARLLHWFSASCRQDVLRNHFKQLRLQRPDRLLLQQCLQRVVPDAETPDAETIVGDVVGVPKAKGVRSLTLTGAKWKTARLFNYFALNCAELTSAKLFNRRLLGRYGVGIGEIGLGKGLESEGDLGDLLAASLLHGTLFLDEINTLQEPRWANIFLRILDKPYELAIPRSKHGPASAGSLLLVCASNVPREALVQRGFNEAVVMRLTATNYFAVPPLRERPVDIAVFTNSWLRRRNRDLAEASRVHRIDHDAMRLLCELPWPDNYRGLKGLLADVLNDRSARGISEPELSFDLVVEALRRRETLRTGARITADPSAMAH